MLEIHFQSNYGSPKFLSLSNNFILNFVRFLNKIIVFWFAAFGLGGIGKTTKEDEK